MLSKVTLRGTGCEGRGSYLRLVEDHLLRSVFVHGGEKSGAGGCAGVQSAEQRRDDANRGSASAYKHDSHMDTPLIGKLTCNNKQDRETTAAGPAPVLMWDLGRCVEQPRGLTVSIYGTGWRINGLRWKQQQQQQQLCGRVRRALLQG